MFKYLLIFLFICNDCYAEVNFDASLIQVGDTIVDKSDYTFSGWIKLVSFGDGGYGSICSTAGDVGISVDDDFDGIAVSSDDYGTQAQSANSSISTGTWYHIAVTRKADGTCNIYIDGTLSGNADQNSGAPINPTQNLLLGQDTVGNFGFDGLQTEVALSTSILTTTQIQLLAVSKVKGMPLQISPATLKVYLPMNDVADGASGDGVTFVDRSGNGNDGVGDDRTGTLLCYGESFLSYPPNPNFQ